MTDHACISLEHPRRWERELVDILARLDAIARGDVGEKWAGLTAAERVNIEPIAANAREKLQRILQARQIVRRLRDRSLSELIAALEAAGLRDQGDCVGACAIAG